MRRKLTTEEFIEKAKKVHGDKYDYSKVDYKGNKTKVRIICKKCGKEFTQIPNNHLKGTGCPYCAVKYKTTEDFIKEAIEVHGDKYDYSKVDYKDNKTKVRIICKKCNKEFLQTPHSHLSGRGCPDCANKERALSQSSNTKEFIEKAKAVHGDKYDYSKVDYKNNSTKVRIICKECGKEFLQTPASHLSGNGCSDCALKRRALCLSSNTEEFIEKARAIHGDNYSYSLVEYINANKKVRIICKECGKEFTQTPSHHLSGAGCPYCADNIKLTTKEFIERAREVHGGMYDYSKVDYTNNCTKVRIICKECGKEFLQSPNIHLRGAGCPFCAGKVKLTTEEFIEKAKGFHGPDKYNYSLVNYNGSKEKVEIICNTCGKHFFQTPNGHLRGCGCPRCNESHGERKIGKILEKYNIKYETQKRFNECRYKNPLPFDFYVPSKNMAIEFDGEQHFEAVDVFGGEKGFKLRKKRDSIKDTFCKENGIKLLRISYDDKDNIEEIIKNNL